MKTLNDYIQIIRKHQKSLPSKEVDVLAIAKDLGLKVFKVNSWEGKISGMIKKEPEGEYAIYVNAKHSEQRQRFTIAHELAHFILHTPLIGDGIADDTLYRSGLSNFVEAEANSFAADILMPREKVDELWKNPDCDLVSMAKIFNVSTDAMAIRLGVPN